MFEVYNTETGEAHEEKYHTGYGATIFATQLNAISVGHHEVRAVQLDTSWMAREAKRLVDHTYRPLPIPKDLYDKLPRDHFVHLSSVNPIMVAFTKNPMMGAKDRQTRLDLRSYLKTYATNLTPLEKELIVTDIANGHDQSHVLFAITSDEIVKVYTNYDRSILKLEVSCMRYKASQYLSRPIHPVSVYGAGDLAVAYLVNDEDKTTARALCWPARKIYSRVYAEDDTLHKELKRLGYTKSSYYGESYENNTFLGAHLLRVYVDEYDAYVMPYIDEPNIGIKKDKGGDTLIICKEWEDIDGISVTETNGLSLNIEDEYIEDGDIDPSVEGEDTHDNIF
jgi:hypothetical protein